MSQERPCHFLVVEDNEDETLLIQRAFAKVSTGASFHACRNLLEAKSYLSGAGVYADRSMPSAILCDLRVGGESGIDFVHWLRAQEGFAATPIIIMSGSCVPQWIRDAYAAGANSVISKPVDFQTFKERIDELARYWCGVVELPFEEDR